MPMAPRVFPGSFDLEPAEEIFKGPETLTIITLLDQGYVISVTRKNDFFSSRHCCVDVITPVNSDELLDVQRFVGWVTCCMVRIDKHEASARAVSSKKK